MLDGEKLKPPPWPTCTYDTASTLECTGEKREGHTRTWPAAASVEPVEELAAADDELVVDEEVVPAGGGYN